MRLPPSPPHPDLDALIEKSRNHVMTPEERRLQRRSWVRGEMMLEHPEMTAKKINKRLDEAEAKGF